MIKQKIKLVRPGLFLPFFTFEKEVQNKIIVRPTVLSICAADQRYFTGARSTEVLRAKLPMCLIHEAIGRVLYDPLQRFRTGQNVILLPNGGENDKKHNYQPNSFFRSSSTDGFTQEFLEMDESELIAFNSLHSKYYVFTELLSVCYQAISQIPSEEWANVKSVGVWGDGTVGYLLSLCIKKEFPNIKITVFGKHEEKLILFSHVDGVETVRQDCSSYPYVDLAFEAVGGSKAGEAVNQIIETIASCSFVCLTGVSEFPILTNTRKILEKGLTLRGASRSLRQDFLKAKLFLDETEDFSLLDKIISNECSIRTPDELTEAFHIEQKIPYKMILNWDI